MCNRWWISNRENKGFLTWGSYKGGGHKMAAWELGLDNSHMYEDAKMADVGNNSMYNFSCFLIKKWELIRIF